jgi:hypothetical protein
MTQSRRNPWDALIATAIRAMVVIRDHNIAAYERMRADLNMVNRRNM